MGYNIKVVGAWHSLVAHLVWDQVRYQIRTSRLIETLRFLSFVSVSNKPFACAVFGVHRVKVLPSDNVSPLSAAHFLY